MKSARFREDAYQSCGWRQGPGWAWCACSKARTTLAVGGGNTGAVLHTILKFGKLRVYPRYYARKAMHSAQFSLEWEYYRDMHSEAGADSANP